MKDERISGDDLYRRYLGSVFSYVLCRWENASEAEDITAEVFAAAVTALPRRRGDGTPYGWLLGIARQKIAEAARRHQRIRHWEVREADLPRRQQETLALMLAADVRELPEDALLREEARRVTRQLLDRLPELQREALLLQYGEGFSVREIGQVLGCSEEAASSLLRRARAAILRHGQDYFKEDHAAGGARRPELVPTTRA